MVILLASSYNKCDSNNSGVIFMLLKIWWIVNFVWLAIILALGIFVGVRQYDAAGVFQTTELKLATLAVLGAFLIFIGLCQALALYFIKKTSH